MELVAKCRTCVHITDSTFSDKNSVSEIWIVRKGVFYKFYIVFQETHT